MGLRPTENFKAKRKEKEGRLNLHQKKERYAMIVIKKKIPLPQSHG